MREYPKDIEDAAEEVDDMIYRNSIDCLPPGDDRLVTEIIADALMAERQRAADIARNAQGPEEAYRLIVGADE